MRTYVVRGAQPIVLIDATHPVFSAIDVATTKRKMVLCRKVVAQISLIFVACFLFERGTARAVIVVMAEP